MSLVAYKPFKPYQNSSSVLNTCLNGGHRNTVGNCGGIVAMKSALAHSEYEPPRFVFSWPTGELARAFILIQDEGGEVCK